MASMNRVFLMGNLTKAPALRYTPSGTAVADLSLAINSSYVNKAGEKKDEVCYVDIVAWGRQAETAAEYLTKGSPILVEGRLQLDSWETGEGDKRSKLRVRAARVQFLGRGKGAPPRPAETEPADEQPHMGGAGDEGSDAAMEPDEGRSDDVPF